MKLIKTHRTRFVSALILTAFLIVSCSVCYVEDYYRATDDALSYLNGDGEIAVTEIEGGLLIDGNGTEDAFIFYPGAKVEYTAYLPLMYKLAEQGMDVFIVKMPCNLAFLGVNKADNIISSYDYAHYYIGGHSLGGAMAASYASQHTDILDGLVLLAAYPTKDISSSSLKVATIYGSLDGVLNMDKVILGRELLPADAIECAIDGGNHAGFGAYGAQAGDNEAEISADDQQKQTTDVIIELTKR